jgi:hypothetical protein
MYLFALTLLPLSSGCAEQSTALCKQIAINSAGKFSFNTRRVTAIATGSGGLGSVANYVIVSPPAGITDVQKIIVMADVKPARSPRCRANSGAERAISCTVSLSDAGLKIVAKFNAGNVDGGFQVYESETRQIASYVSKEVICDGSRK